MASRAAITFSFNCQDAAVSIWPQLMAFNHFPCCQWHGETPALTGVLAGGRIGTHWQPESPQCFGSQYFYD